MWRNTTCWIARRSSGLLFAWLMLPSASAAQPRGFEVHWDAPAASCPSEEDVLQRLEALLRESKRQDIALYTIILRVRQERNTWNLKLWSVAPDATNYRTVEADDCDALAELGVVITAFLVDPEVLATLPEGSLPMLEQARTQAEEQAVPEPPTVEKKGESRGVASSNSEAGDVRVATDAPSTADATAAHSPQSAPSDSTSSAPTPKDPQAPPPWLVHVGGGASFGSLPQAAPVLLLGGTGQWQSWQLSGQAHLELPQSKELTSEGARARLGLAALSISGCPIWAWQHLRSRACAVGELGTLFARGIELDVERSAVGVWAALGASARLGLFLHRSLELYVEGEFLWAVGRTHVTVDNYGLVHQPDRFIFRPQVGVQWTLPVDTP